MKEVPDTGSIPVSPITLTAIAPRRKVVNRSTIENILFLYSISGNIENFSYLVDYDHTKTNILFYLPDKSELEKSKMVLELKKFIYELTSIEKSNIITYPKYKYF